MGLLPRLIACTIALLIVVDLPETAGRAFGRQETLDSRSAGARELLQARCNTIHPACKTCRSQRTPGKSKTVLVCSSCDVGYTLRAGNPFFCDCAAGYMPANNTRTCTGCVKGKYCPGPNENGTVPAQPCPTGLATFISGAKSLAQCFTKPGYGRKAVTSKANGMVSYVGVLCNTGDYNLGGNTMACQKCPAGLTTSGPGAAKLQDCIAPPGHYMELSKARNCPKGTFMPVANNASRCISCPNGTLTEGEGALTEADCWLVPKGYYYDAINDIAVPCPLHTYQDKENNDPACIRCPNGWMTQDTATTGAADCLLPPGYELRGGAKNITMCEIGWYKSGWNRNPCVACGDDLLTDAQGALQDDDCFVLPGQEAIQDERSGLWAAFPCTNNRYGNTVPMHNLLESRCIPCPANTFTLDFLTGNTSLPGSQGYESCLVKPGWGLDDGLLAEPCYVGEWSAGFHRLPCTKCPAAYTTLQEESVSEADCVVQPGWTLDHALGLPKPCDKGTYGLGGSSDDPGGNCTRCPAGYTTQLEASDSIDHCSVCDTGFGGPQCTVCPYGTYSTGGTSNDCVPCRPGFTTARGASQNSQCLAVWPLNFAGDTVHILLSDEAAWQRLPAGSASQDACEQECAGQAACMMYRYHDAACDVFLGVDASQPGRAAVGFKAWGGGVVQDYSFYHIPSSIDIGEKARGAGTFSSLKPCVDACSSMEDCVIVRVEGSGSGNISCSLHVGSSDSEWVSSYKVTGSGLLSDGFDLSTR